MKLLDKNELNEIRQLFPHTRDQLYLNHAAISPLSTRVLDAMSGYLRARSTGKIENFEKSLAVIDQTKELLGKLIGVEKTGIALLKNTSEGLNVIATGLDLKEGDRVLLNDMEFPSNVFPFLNLKKNGVEVDFAKSEYGRVDIETLERSMTPRTKLLSISHVSFLTGYRVDLPKLADLCRQRGVYLSVDAIQSAGAMSLDAGGSDVDFVSCGGHKWLMSPLGTGFLYVRKDRLEDIRLTYLSWLSMKEPFDFFRYETDIREDAGRFEYAAPNVPGIVGMKAAVALFLEVGVKRIEGHLLALLGYLRERLAGAGFEVLSAFPPEESSGILLFRTPDAEGLAARLAENNITISVREGAIRVSPHFYNTPDEMDRFVTAVKRSL